MCIVLTHETIYGNTVYSFNMLMLFYIGVANWINFPVDYFVKSDCTTSI